MSRNSLLAADLTPYFKLSNMLGIGTGATSIPPGNREFRARYQLFWSLLAHGPTNVSDERLSGCS
jgi:hypothetical protein